VTSLIEMRNKKGPKTLSWGIPFMRGRSKIKQERILTLWDLLVKNDLLRRADPRYEN